MRGGDRNPARRASDDAGLPPFCEPAVVFAVMLVAQLLVCVIALTSPGRIVTGWRGFAMITLYVQWVALASISLLCVLRPWLARFGVTGGLVAGWVLVVVVTALGSAAAWWLDRALSLGMGASGYPLRSLLVEALAVSALVSAAALRYLHIQAEWQRNVRVQAEARVQALQARIRPHFLFNSMNTIASLIQVRPETAESVVEDLADLFRAALRDRRHASLAEELDLARRYVRIEQLRLGERLRMEWQTDDAPGDARVPPLILQPLVENAVYHGIQPLAEGGTVVISGGREGRRVWISVDNPVPKQDAAGRGDGNRMAQENIRQRLRYFYGERATLEVSREGGRYRATLSFPYRSEKDEDTHR